MDTKWEKLKKYIKEDMEESRKEKEIKENLGDVVEARAWFVAEETAKIILYYMEILAKEET